MGKYSDNISARLNHTKIVNGFCLICGNYSKLTKDHVPPKGSITITKIEQKHIVEFLSTEAKYLKGIASAGGSTFRTICSECNNIKIGANDNEISRICSELTQKIKVEPLKYDGTPNTLVIKVDALKYARAMIGHILAATSVKECLQQQNETSYLSPMKHFVLGDDEAISDSHEIYYWFYPHKRHLSAKMVIFHDSGNNSCLSLLSFFPLAFLVIEKNSGIFPPQARKLNLKDTTLSINLSMYNSKYIDFPFCELPPTSFHISTSQQCIISYPIQNTENILNRRLPINPLDMPL